MTNICISDLTIIGSDNGLSPGRRQAIIRTNAGILLKRPLGTNFSEILIEILLFSFKKMRLKVSSAKRRPFCLGLNVLKTVNLTSPPVPKPPSVRWLPWLTIIFPSCRELSKHITIHDAICIHDYYPGRIRQHTIGGPHQTYPLHLCWMTPS